MTPEKRKKMIALIHTQKSEAKLDDEAYRAILAECAQVESSADMKTVAQFSAVISALNAVLKAQGKAVFGRTGYVMSAFAWATLQRAERILGQGSATRLSGFLEKIGKEKI